MNAINLIDATLYLMAGVVLGAVYFLLLLCTVRLHATQAAAIRIVPFYILRFAATISAFWVIAQRGAWPTLLVLIGFLVARVVVQRWIVSD